MTLATYLKHRRHFETFYIAAIVLLTCAFNATVEIIDLERLGATFSRLQPWILEITSSVALLAMMPVMLWFDRRFPLQFAMLRTALPAHLAFSVVFSFGHVWLMYVARQRLFPWLLERPYHWDNWAG
ncbi:MAG: hypothetical protein AB8G16_19685, partial [Gammaproteobacteria bacterium]